MKMLFICVMTCLLPITTQAATYPWERAILAGETSLISKEKFPRREDCINLGMAVVESLKVKPNFRQIEQHLNQAVAQGCHKASDYRALFVLSGKTFGDQEQALQTLAQSQDAGLVSIVLIHLLEDCKTQDALTMMRKHKDLSVTHEIAEFLLTKFSKHHPDEQIKFCSLFTKNPDLKTMSRAIDILNTSKLQVYLKVRHVFLNYFLHNIQNRNLLAEERTKLVEVNLNNIRGYINFCAAAAYEPSRLSNQFKQRCETFKMGNTLYLPTSR